MAGTVHKTNYVFVDHENVSLEAIEHMDHEFVRLLVFVGAQQKRGEMDAAIAIKKMGARAEYVKVSTSGPNALDFHIAFYLGRLAEQNQSASFHIVSKDKGYDPLVAHLKSQDISVARWASVKSVKFGEPQVRLSAEKGGSGALKQKAIATKTKAAANSKSGVTGAVATAMKNARHYLDNYLMKPKTTKPSKRSTLRASINSFFKRELESSHIDKVVLALQSSKVLRFDGDKTIWLFSND